MAFVMADEHHPDTFGAKLVKEVIGKAIEVRPPKALVRQMKPQRILRNPIDDVPQLVLELVGEPAGDFPVVESDSSTSARTCG